jgi:hypothetical protein
MIFVYVFNMFLFGLIRLLVYCGSKHIVIFKDDEMLDIMLFRVHIKSF